MRFSFGSSVVLFSGVVLIACETRHSGEGTAAQPRLSSTDHVPSDTTTRAVLPTAPLDTAALLGQVLGANLRGYQLEFFTQGDINQDKRADFIAVFRTIGETDSITGSDSYSRRVALVLNQGFPHLSLAALNDHVIQCSDCGGGGVGDPHRGITIRNGYFSFESLYGACQKTYYVTTFRYSKPQREWFLYKIGQDEQDCNDTISVRAHHEERTGRDFGKVTFASFQGE